jgi:nucleotide-binding universal stress UspA family protein
MAVQRKSERNSQRNSQRKSQKLRKVSGKDRAIVGKAVWAVDPFEKDAKRVLVAHQLVDFFARELAWKVQPISVIGPMDVNWPIELRGSLRTNIAQTAQDSLSPAFEDIARDAVMLEPRILIQPTSSLTASVDYLLASAKKDKAQVIVLSTHGRRGLLHFRLGSFAETVIASSKTPVLTMNPKATLPKGLSTILVPTDFSSTSRRVFVRMLEWACALSANGGEKVKIVLVHRFESPVPALFYGGGELAIDSVLMRQMLEDAEAARRRQCAQWEKLAINKGVSCETIIANEGRDLSSLILATAKAVKADLIGMATYRGPIGQGLLGSVARDVLLTAHCPVVIVHR